jgi:exosome complex RNA-binding protein Rrp4
VNMDHIFHKQLQLATNMIKQIADKRRMKREFHVGDLVYLESQSYR